MTSCGLLAVPSARGTECVYGCPSLKEDAPGRKVQTGVLAPRVSFSTGGNEEATETTSKSSSDSNAMSVKRITF